MIFTHKNKIIKFLFQLQNLYYSQNYKRSKQAMPLTQKSKPIIFLTTLSLLLMLALLITMLVRGYQDFTFIATPAQAYFILKNNFQSQVGHRARIASTATAILFEVVLDIIMIKIHQKREQFKPSLVKEYGIYLLICLSIMSTISPALFYTSLSVQRYRKGATLYWDELSMCCQGIISLILIIICWVIVVRSLQTEINNLGNSLNNQNQNTQQNDTKQKNIEMQNFMKDQMSLNKQIRFKELFQNIDHNPMKTLEQQASKDKKLSQTQAAQKILLDFKNKINNQYTKKDQQQIEQTEVRKQREVKISKRKEESQKLQRLLLKAQIQKRKKKFRQMNPNKIHHRQSEEQDIQLQLIQQNCKLTKLPKSYRQYIRDAKKPNRIVPTNPTNKVSSGQYPQQSDKIQHFGQDNEYSFAQNQDQNEINKVKKNKSLRQNLLAKQQLIYQKSLKKKPRKKIKLFDETIRQYEMTFQEISNQTTRPNKSERKKQLTMEEYLLANLKNKNIQPESSI